MVGVALASVSEKGSVSGFQTPQPPSQATARAALQARRIRSSSIAHMGQLQPAKRRPVASEVFQVSGGLAMDCPDGVSKR
jgi:hypothetical protein